MVESIGDGRCSGLCQTDIWVGASCSEIRPNGNVVSAGTDRATVVFELVEVDPSTGAGRTDVQVEENSLVVDAYCTSSWSMELERYLDVLCSATIQELRRPVGAMAECAPSRVGDGDGGGVDGDNGQDVRGRDRGPYMQRLSEDGGDAMWKDMRRGLDQRLQ